MPGRVAMDGGDVGLQIRKIGLIADCWTAIWSRLHDWMPCAQPFLFWDGTDNKLQYDSSKVIIPSFASRVSQKQKV